MREEITQAANGRTINNMTQREIREHLVTVAKRLGYANNKIPFDDQMDYITDQVYRRHHYKVDELLLAVDYYHAGLITLNRDKFEHFGIATINKLMAGYREIKAKYLKEEEQEDVNTDRLNEIAREELTLTIFNAFRDKKAPPIIIMECWRIIARNLIRKMVIDQSDIDRHLEEAKRLYKQESVRQQQAKYFRDLMIFGEDLHGWQCYLAVKEYMTWLVEQTNELKYLKR
jgi:hypothetical protein